MSERINVRTEHQPAANHESAPDTGHEKAARHEQPAKPEKPAAQVAHEARQKVRHETIRDEARLDPLEELEASEKASQAARPTHVNRDLQSITLRRELQSIRRKLPVPQRALSRVIHQPVVRVVSEAAGRTVSRPSGLLGGSLVAFAGTSTYLYLANRMGFRYNSGVFLVLFAGGFAFGLLLELLVHLATASRRKAVD